jgi:hypothetical protein
MPDKIKNQKSNYAYRPKFGIIVICESEEEQKKTYESLHTKGYKLKVVNV